MNKKNIIKKSVLEAKIMTTIDNMDKVMPKLKKDDVVKLVDEEIVSEDEDESASRSVEYGINPEVNDADWEEISKSVANEGKKKTVKESIKPQMTKDEFTQLVKSKLK